jgi:hypothetical protein
VENCLKLTIVIIVAGVHNVSLLIFKNPLHKMIMYFEIYGFEVEEAPLVTEAVTSLGDFDVLSADVELEIAPVDVDDPVDDVSAELVVVFGASDVLESYKIKLHNLFSLQSFTNFYRSMDRTPKCCKKQRNQHKIFKLQSHCNNRFQLTALHSMPFQFMKIYRANCGHIMRLINFAILYSLVFGQEV